MPTRLRDLTDTDLAALDDTKNKNIMRFNATTGKFDVITIDSTLGISTDIPQTFVQTVENEIDADNIASFTGVDGGSF